MKKGLNKLIAGIAAAVVLAVPAATIQGRFGPVQEASAAGIDYNNLGRYWSIKHIIRTFERCYLENGYFSIPKMLQNRDYFNRFLRQCSDRDNKLFDQYLAENMNDFIDVPGYPHRLTFDEWLYTVDIDRVLSGKNPVNQGDPHELAYYYDLYTKIYGTH